jgi:hypothetical protein
MHNELGFGEEEIARAVREYDLMKDPEYLEMQPILQATMQAN